MLTYTIKRYNLIGIWAHMIQTSNKFDIFIRKNITQFILKLILLIVPNLLVLAIVYPGFIQADHQNTIAYIPNGRFDEWHSLLWGFFAYPFLYLSGSIAVYGIVQIAIFAISIQYSLHTLQKIDILSNRSTWILTCIFALSPTFLMYNELYSSDVIFSILLTPLTTMLIYIWKTKGKILSQIPFTISLTLLFYIIFELRKNAALIIIFGFAFLFFLFKKYRKQSFLMLIGCVGLILCTSLFNTYVLQTTKSPSQELLSVPVQQIGRAFADGGKIPDEAKKTLEKIRPLSEWKTDYRPENSDYLKFNNKHPDKEKVTLTPAFIKAWATIGVNNPRSYVKAYVDLMYPYWQLGATRSTTLIYVDFANHDNYTVTACANACNTNYIKQFDMKNTTWQDRFSRAELIIDGLHIPLLTDLADFIFFNRALPLWIFIIGLIISLKKKVTRYYLLVSLPLWCILLSLLAFSPVACFRYALQMYYLMPLLVSYLVFISKRNKMPNENVA